MLLQATKERLRVYESDERQGCASQPLLGLPVPHPHTASAGGNSHNNDRRKGRSHLLPRLLLSPRMLTENSSHFCWRCSWGDAGTLSLLMLALLLAPLLLMEATLPFMSGGPAAAVLARSWPTPTLMALQMWGKSRGFRACVSCGRQATLHQHHFT